MPSRCRFTVQCLDAEECTVFFEPEGGFVDLVRGQTISVEISGGVDHAVPEVAYRPDGIMIGAWSGALTLAWDEAGNQLDI